MIFTNIDKSKDITSDSSYCFQYIFFFLAQHSQQSSLFINPSLFYSPVFNVCLNHYKHTIYHIPLSFPVFLLKPLLLCPLDSSFTPCIRTSSLSLRSSPPFCPSPTFLHCLLPAWPHWWLFVCPPKQIQHDTCNPAHTQIMSETRVLSKFSQWTREIPTNTYWQTTDVRIRIYIEL